MIDIGVGIRSFTVLELNIGVGFPGGLVVSKVDEVPVLDFVVVLDVLSDIGVTVSNNRKKILFYPFMSV